MHLKDYFKTNEEFELKHNEELDMYTTSSIPSEDKIGFYYEDEAYISHSDSVNSPMDFIYSLAKQYMLKRKLKWVKSYIRKGSFLDIGCGTGDFLWLLKQNKFLVKGVEPSNRARNITSSKGIHVYSSIKEAEPESYDAVCLWHALEHIPDLSSFFISLNKFTKIGGFVFVAVPNFKSFDASYYKKYWAAYDVPRHIHHFSQQAITTIFKEHNYQLLQTKGLPLDAYYVSLLSEKYKGSNSILNAIKTGFLSNWKARQTNEWSSVLYIFKKLK